MAEGEKRDQMLVLEHKDWIVVPQISCFFLIQASAEVSLPFHTVRGVVILLYVADPALRVHEALPWSPPKDLWRHHQYRLQHRVLATVLYRPLKPISFIAFGVLPYKSTRAENIALCFAPSHGGWLRRLLYIPRPSSACRRPDCALQSAGRTRLTIKGTKVHAVPGPRTEQ